MKTPVLITLVIVGGMLMAVPFTCSFILRLQGRPDSFPLEEISPCIYGGFSLVIGAILLAFFARWLDGAAKAGRPGRTPPARRSKLQAAAITDRPAHE